MNDHLPKPGEFFVPMTERMLKSPAYSALSHAEARILNYFLIAWNRATSCGKLDCHGMVFSRSSCPCVSDKTLREGMRRLAQLGFAEVVSARDGIATLYRFSNAWTTMETTPVTITPVTIAVVETTGGLHDSLAGHPGNQYRGRPVTTTAPSYEEDPEDQIQEKTPPPISPQGGECAGGGELFAVDSLKPSGRRAPRAKQTATPTTDEVAAFNTWYAIYPRHEKREDGLKAFVVAIREKDGPTHDVLLRKAREYADERKRACAPRDKIALPASWLNARRWTDDYTPTTAGKPANGSTHGRGRITGPRPGEGVYDIVHYQREEF